MTASDDRPPSGEGVQEPPQSVDYAFWKWGSVDKRMLYLTFVGGLAANIGLVLVLGLGLLVVHLIKYLLHKYPGVENAATAFSLAGLVVAILGVVSAFAAEAQARAETRASRIFLRILSFGAGLIAALILLAIIGYADGIK